MAYFPSQGFGCHDNRDVTSTATDFPIDRTVIVQGVFLCGLLLGFKKNRLKKI